MADKFIAAPGTAAFLALVFWLVGIFLLRCILSDLMEMHKSKTALKKIRREYTFRQKLLLRHVGEHAEHAAKFTRLLILFHHASAFTMALSLIQWLLWPGKLSFCILAGRFALFDVPVMLLDFLLDEHTLKKRVHRRRFRKYHNTPDKTSLF